MTLLATLTQDQLNLQTHTEPNKDLGIGSSEHITADDSADHRRPTTFLEAIEISGETSNIGGNEEEFILVKGLDRTERAVRKSEQDLRIYEPGELTGQILQEDFV